jgi:hypothetical protein
MRQLAAILALVTTALLLTGCVYDPYTGTYVPCCNYYAAPYYYRYPPPYYPYGYPPGPYTGPQQPPPGGYGSPPPPFQPGASAYPAQGGGLAQRFAAANVTRDGMLTREQAAAGMPMVAQNFDVIDRDHKGYVTLPEVRAFAAERRAERSQPGQPTLQ